MSMYDWDDLIKGWELETLTVEKAIGQLLAWGQLVAKSLRSLGVKLSNLVRRPAALERRLKEQD